MIEVLADTSIDPSFCATHVSLRTRDGRRFLCHRASLSAASPVVAHLLADLGGAGPVAGGGDAAPEMVELPLPAVVSDTLGLVMEYVGQHYGPRGGPSGTERRGSTAGPPAAPAEIERPLRADLATVADPWDWRFVSDRLLHSASVERADDAAALFNVMAAANFLGIAPLRDLCAATVANTLRSKSEDEILAFFGATGPFTRAQEEEVCRDYPWLREGFGGR